MDVGDPEQRRADALAVRRRCRGDAGDDRAVGAHRRRGARGRSASCGRAYGYLVRSALRHWVSRGEARSRTTARRCFSRPRTRQSSAKWSSRSSASPSRCRRRWRKRWQAAQVDGSLPRWRPHAAAVATAFRAAMCSERTRAGSRRHRRLSADWAVERSSVAAPPRAGPCQHSALLNEATRFFVAFVSFVSSCQCSWQRSLEETRRHLRVAVIRAPDEGPARGTSARRRARSRMRGTTTPARNAGPAAMNRPCIDRWRGS